MNKDLCWIVAVGLGLPLLGCASADTGERPLRLSLDEKSIDGTFEQDGMLVRFDATSSDDQQQATLALDVDGILLDISLDLAAQTLVEDAHGRSFGFEHRAAFLALRDAISSEHPEVMSTFHGKVLVRVADRFAEVPVGPELARHPVDLFLSQSTPIPVLLGCGGDGVSCLPGDSGSSWAVFSAPNLPAFCEASQVDYGDNECRGRCGMGCNWFDHDYTWDCLDHDVCLDFSNDCADEFGDAADDWAATLAPLCFGGSTRPKPPTPDGTGGNGGSGGAPGTTGGLVINEVDYDQPGIDNTEFIEIYNGTSGVLTLDQLVLVLVNGASGAEYRRIPLSGTLAAGAYLVVCAKGASPGTCAAGVSVPTGTAVKNFAFASDNVQNGAPDGVVLIDLASNTVVDALSYEGAITAAVVTGLASPSLVETQPATAADSGSGAGALARHPNGKDSNDAASDWSFRPPTPGAPNL